MRFSVLQTFIILSPSWSCSLYPVTVKDAKYSVYKKEPDYFSFQPQFDYIKLNRRKSRWPHQYIRSFELCKHVLSSVIRTRPVHCVLSRLNFSEIVVLRLQTYMYMYMKSKWHQHNVPVHLLLHHCTMMKYRPCECDTSQ